MFSRNGGICFVLLVFDLRRPQRRSAERRKLTGSLFDAQHRNDAMATRVSERVRAAQGVKRRTRNVWDIMVDR